jgi:hypothetical protein
MKSRSILYVPVIIILVLVYGFGGNTKWPGGSPGGYTGSPGDGKDCTQCHGGSAAPELNWITSNIPDGGYIPGETYTIIATAYGAGDKGFEVSPQDVAGNLLGTLNAGSGTKLVAGNTAVTQTTASSANPKEWQFEWVAPEAGTGDVTFYGAFTVNKPVTKLSTYIAHENTGVSIAELHSPEIHVYPNPASEIIHIYYRSVGSGNLSIDLIYMSGQAVPLLSNAEVKAGLNTFDILLPAEISPGTFILNFKDNTSSSQYKIIIK